MKYFIDTEFIYAVKNGSTRVKPISIALVREDGEEFYAVCLDTFTQREIPNFVRTMVLPQLFAVAPEPGPLRVLPSPGPWRCQTIRSRLVSWVAGDTPEFIGEYSAFDYVVLSTIMGGFEQWPQNWPMWINDLKQEAFPEVASQFPHNALADARAVRDAYNSYQPEPKGA